MDSWGSSFIQPFNNKGSQCPEGQPEQTQAGPTDVPELEVKDWALQETTTWQPDRPQLSSRGTRSQRPTLPNASF